MPCSNMDSLKSKSPSFSKWVLGLKGLGSMELNSISEIDPAGESLTEVTSVLLF